MKAPAKLALNRSARWAWMDRFEVPDYDTDGTYLTRWRVIQTPIGGIYLHRFTGPDPRRTLHDHPWPFLSIVLRGSYREIRNQKLARWVKRFNAKRSTDLHAITQLGRVPTWTLMLVGRRCRVWGYRDLDGTWTPFDQHPHDAEFKAALARRKARA